MSAKSSRPKPGWYIVGTPEQADKYIVVFSIQGTEVWITNDKSSCIYHYTKYTSPLNNPTDWEIKPL